jgi:hypothetical protein
VWAHKKYGIPGKDAAGAMVVDLLHEVAALGTLALAAVLMIPRDSLPASASGQLDAIGTFAGGCLGFYAVCVASSLGWRFVPERFHHQTLLTVFTKLAPHQFAALWALKVVKNLAMGLFVTAGLVCFGMAVPAVVGVGFTQVILLVRGLPVTAFGLGVDQMSIPAMFGPWDEPAGQVLAFSVAYTFALFAGRAVLGIPFVGRVMAEVRQEEPGTR